MHIHTLFDCITSRERRLVYLEQPDAMRAPEKGPKLEEGLDAMFKKIEDRAKAVNEKLEAMIRGSGKAPGDESKAKEMSDAKEIWVQFNLDYRVMISRWEPGADALVKQMIIDALDGEDVKDKTGKVVGRKDGIVTKAEKQLKSLEATAKAPK